jgi:hypothetical protein
MIESMYIYIDVNQKTSFNRHIFLHLLSFSLFNMPTIYHVYVIYSLIMIINGSRINQKILVGPHHISAYAGETVQFPCIVSKQSDAIVTWCWNDFCTLGKAQLIGHETTSNGLISIYQYTAYPRFRLLINERLSMYIKLTYSQMFM